MANPVVYKADSTEAGDTALTITFAVGATGAVGAVTPSTRTKEFKRTTPVVRQSAGVYDIFLRESWLGCLMCSGGIDWNSQAFDATAGSGVPQLIVNNVSSATPKVRVQFNRTDTGVAADPTNGVLATVRLHLKRFKPL